MAELPAESASELVGATPAPSVRPVSLAIRRYLEEYSPGGLAIAVSGGADSLALAVCALDLAVRGRIPAITLTVDHRLRPDSAGEAQQVARLMESLGAQQSLVLTGEMPTGSGPEGAARELRYGLLRRAATDFALRQQLDTVDLLFGHTMDDQAETVLLRLARGAGSAALGGIRRRRSVSMPGNGSTLQWGRPLLGVRRAQTEACCAALGLTPVEDPTNQINGSWRAADGGPLRRSAVRHRALPELAKAVGQDIVPALARVAEQSQADDSALTEWARSVLEQATAEDKAGISVAPLEEVPPAVRTRALRLFALAAGVAGGALSAVHVERLNALVEDWHGQGAVDLPGGVRVWRRSGVLQAGRAD